MACLSSSPPPMMPEDDEEEEDSSLAEGYQDLSESDNAPYDLTGLSDKIHSIPKDAIHVTPKEFARTNDVDHDQHHQQLDGQFVIRVNGLGIPQTLDSRPPEDDLDDVPELDLDDPPGMTKPDEGHDFFEPEVSIETYQPEKTETESANSVEASDAIVCDDLGPKVDAQLEDASDVEEELNCVVTDPAKVVPDTDSEFPSLHLSEPNEVDSHQSSPTSDVENNESVDKIFDEEAKSVGVEVEDIVIQPELVERSFDEFVCAAVDPQLPSNVAIDPVAGSVAVGGAEVEAVDEDFGAFADFDSNSCWAQPDQFSAAASAPPVVAVVEETPEAAVSDRVLHLEDDDDDDGGGDDDDDFGDFDSAAVISEPAASVVSNTHSTTFSLQNNMAEMLPKVTSVISHLFTALDESLDDEKPEDPTPKAISALNPNPPPGDDEGDETWMKIREIETTPALQLGWKNSSTQNYLMKMLKIDPRNIVLEAKPRKFSPGGVPAFASGLSPSAVLQPIKAETLEPTQTAFNAKSHSDVISENNNTKSGNLPPAQFDWQTSGLKNPLDQSARPIEPETSLKESHSTTSNGSLKAEVPAAITATRQPPRSREAIAILESFPLLNFMQSQVLMLPTDRSKP